MSNEIPRGKQKINTRNRKKEKASIQLAEPAKRLDGDLFSPSLTWLQRLPLFGFSLGGMVFGVILGAILFADAPSLLSTDSENILPPSSFGYSEAGVMVFLGIAAMLAILLVLAFLYTSWQRAVQMEIHKASRAKNEFLSGISHELRNPLNSILGFSEVLSRGYLGKLNKEQAKHVAYISASGDHLLALVDNLLDINRIKEDKLDFNPKSVNLKNLMNSSMQLIRPTAEAKSISLVHETNESLAQLWIFLDESKFLQALTNLLSNAIKFTPEHGRVVVGTYIKNSNFVVSIQDTGPGIAAEYTKLIFERFFQVNQRTDSKDPGSGLGLPISLHLAKMHGGRIFLKDSSNSSGSCFVFEIPMLVAVKPDTLVTNS
jgi:signal transduction histidine kinase